MLRCIQNGSLRDCIGHGRAYHPITLAQAVKIIQMSMKEAESLDEKEKV